jgi:hypothetical protein
MNKSLQVLVTAVTCQTATKIMINRDKGSVTKLGSAAVNRDQNRNLIV